MARALGRYELLRPLARGGMAEVYLARRRAAGIEKWLVVKRMRPERTGDPRFLDLFVREARLSMSLAHQNIVPVFDFGRIDDQVFLAMERIEGRDLGSSLARAADHRLSPLLAAFVAAECCQALDYAHQRKGPDGVALGIVHRDVTPRNVLLSWSGEVKLTDFGIAALAGDATSRLLGTPQYMAPEQARSEPIDPRADIYAIGLVLREAVSGARPRPGNDRDAILEAARRGDLVPWPHLAAGVAAGGEAAAAGAAAAGAEAGAAAAAAAAVEAPAAAAAAEAPAVAGAAPATPATAEPTGEPPPAGLVAIIDRATAIAAADRYPDARTMLEDLDAFIVAERSARKAESPARQLALWLATVWEDARDDAEDEAAIQAEHLVSFLDDGAVDVIGTGTVRSLAATAADDVPVGGAGGAAAGHAGTAGASATATPGAPASAAAAPASAAAASSRAKPTVLVAPDAIPSAKPAIIPVPGLRPDDRGRASRISSSTSTVVSGSFQTLPAARRRLRERRLRAVSSLGSLALVAVAAGAVVFWVMNGRRDHRTEPAGGSAAGSAAVAAATTPAGSAAGQSPAGQSGSAQSPAAQSPAAQSPAAQSPAAQSPAAQSPAAQSPAAQSAKSQSGSATPPAPPASGSADPARPDGAAAAPPKRTGASSAAPTRGASPASGASGPPSARPAAGLPANRGTGSSAGAPGAGSGSDHPAAASSDATPSGSPDPARPQTCRVRINLTPWAYYTADDDTARHETPGTIDLTPGPHRLHVWNPELHVERDIVITVPADRDAMNYSEPLQPTSLPHESGVR